MCFNIFDSKISLGWFNKWFRFIVLYFENIVNMTLFIIDDDSNFIFFKIALWNTKSLTFLLWQSL